MFRGVYLVGPIVPPLGREMAAVLACGEKAVLSHRSAASLWNLLPYPAPPTVHVTVPPGRSRDRPGIRVHRQLLQADEMRMLTRIPITTPTRTLLDLAADVGAGELEQAVAQAERRHLASRTKLLSLLARYPGRRGTPALRVVLGRDGRPAMTRSRAERRFLALVRKARLPEPEVNLGLGPYEIDFLWREERLVVETDGWEFHSSRESFEADRRRDADLVAQGFTVMRVTWRQLADEPAAVLVRLAQALARSAPA
jgi:very-short-patch-repair endonuclease